MEDSPRTPSEGQLIHRAVQGDAEAFGELYMLHLDRIYRDIFYKVGNDVETEDLTEQVFLKAWEVMEGYRHEGRPFCSWLYRIAHNLIVDHYRTRKSPEPFDSVAFALADEAMTPEELFIKQAEVACLREALTQLREDQQHVLLLRFVEGLSHAQVAQIVGKSEGAVRVIQYRSLSVLSDILRKE